MKYLKQFAIVTGVSLAGELLHHFIDLPVPASIYGMVLLFVLLETGLLKLSAIRETADFLLAVMPVMFVPAAVGILESWELIRPSLAGYLITTVAVTVIVMAAAGLVTQAIAGARKNTAAEDSAENGGTAEKEGER